MQPYINQPDYNQSYQPDYSQGYQPDYSQGYNQVYPPQQTIYNQGAPGYQGYPPQQTNYQQPPQQPIYQPPQQQTMIIVHNENQDQERCPHCNSSVGFTKTKVIGSTVFWMCFILFLFTFVCCWLAFFMDDLMDTEVKCANCGSVVKVIPAGEDHD